MAARSLILVLSLLPALMGCSGSGDGDFGVVLIGSEEEAFTDGARLSTAAAHLRSATDWGLVAFNAQGDVVPALAERWIVTDDGRSFIFRLREGTWPDGSELTAESVRTELLEAIEQLDGTSLGLDLSSMVEVRAMTGRVIELQLASPEPYLLQLLAQPELALRPQSNTGPMAMERQGTLARLVLKPPLARGLPEEENWQENVRPIDLRVASAPEAIAMFDRGEAEIVLGGDLGSFPLLPTGPLSSGTIRLNSATGLFGLLVNSDDDLLGDQGVREALAMAIDRSALLARYNVGGWASTTRPVAPGLPGDPGFISERWADVPMDDLRQEARSRIATWHRREGEGDLSQPARLSIMLEEGPGWNLLFRDLAEQLAQIGVQLVRAQDRGSADLVLIDRVARYPAPRWFLNQFNCSLERGMCDEEADAMVQAALEQPDTAARARMMAEAEALLTLSNVYIPIGAPLRWSLVRGSVAGFEPNVYAYHPLPPMAELPR